MKALFSLLASSGLQAGLMAVLSLLLAWRLPAEEFGVTRLVTNYMVVLAMLGHCTLHDAASSFVATSRDRSEASSYFFTAAWLTLALSLLSGAGFYTLVACSGLWLGDTASALRISALSLPFIALSIVFTSVLQASGSHLRMAVNQSLAGLVPLVIILPLAWWLALEGWVIGRLLAAVVFCGAALWCLRGLYTYCLPDARRAMEMVRFARYQLISGLLSLFLMSADLILLERLTGSLELVAEYGFAVLFVKLLMFIPSAVGRLYFRQIAEARSQDELFSAVSRFALLTTLATALGYALIVAGFYVLDAQGVLEKYSRSKSLLLYLGPAALLGGLWHVASVVNICQKQPQVAALMSLVAAVTLLVAGYYLVVAMGGAGMALALAVANLLGLLTGLWLWRLRLRREPGLWR